MASERLVSSEKVVSPADIMFTEIAVDSSQSTFLKREAELASEFHAGFIIFMISRKVDVTYRMIANMQYNLERKLANTSDIAEREELLKIYEEFANDNQEQIEETARLRRMYTADVSN